MRTRYLLIAAVAVALGASSYGLAASQSETSRELGANAAVIGRCDSDGITLVQNLSGSSVTSVTVGSIAAACGSASISVTVNNGTTTRTGTGTVPSGGGSVTVTLASSIAAADDEQIDVSIMGP
jgi:hypothetical protein